ncbi:MAG TPA: ABC transporter substrate-binding protein [Burkholderiaceae bacterium]|nr:ABC transporter substrate-binding protein [Burkholderiaceae bacterium]
MRKPLCLALAAAFISVSGPVLAEDLYLAAYGGSTETLFKDKIIPEFEKQTGARVIYVAGNSTDTLAKLQAERGNPQFDVIIVDDAPMQQAVQFGFCSDIAPAPIYDDLYPLARIAGDKALALGVIGTGLFYNTEYFAKKNWPAPTSWEDVTDSKYKDKVVIPPITNGYGLHALIKFAELRGGSVNNIDPGFKAMLDEVGPNVLAWEPSPGKMTELFQNGDAVIGVWGSGRVQALKDTGFPVEFVYPKEGALALFTAVCPVAKPKTKELSQKFIQYLYQPEVQAILAAGQAWGPMNSKVDLTPEVAATVPYGPEQIGKLQGIDNAVVNANRAEWTNRWNRTVER